MKKYNVIIHILTIALFLWFTWLPAFANWPDHGTMYGDYQMMDIGMDWMMLLFWGLLLGILILVVRWVANLPKEGRFPNSEKTAMEILKERFAKGEINIIEFESKKQTISD